MSTTPNTLKPCPFCGSDARQSSGPGTHHPWYGTGCSERKCPASLSMLVHDSQEVADAAWNRRAHTERGESVPVGQAAASAAPPSLPLYIVREAQRAIEAAEKPSGMGAHDGKAVIPACYLRRLLVEATQPPAGWAEFVAWWEAQPSDAFGGSIEALAKAAFKAGAAQQQEGGTK